MTAPAEHDYLSTACLHDLCRKCQASTRDDGTPKRPASCKWCGAPCRCSCHDRAASDTGPNPPDLNALRGAVRRRERTVAEIMRRAADAGLPMTTGQARIAYDVTRESR